MILGFLFYLLPLTLKVAVLHAFTGRDVFILLVIFFNVNMRMTPCVNAADPTVPVGLLAGLLRLCGGAGMVLCSLGAGFAAPCSASAAL